MLLVTPEFHVAGFDNHTVRMNVEQPFTLLSPVTAVMRI